MYTSLQKRQSNRTVITQAVKGTYMSIDACPQLMRKYMKNCNIFDLRLGVELIMKDGALKTDWNGRDWSRGSWEDTYTGSKLAGTSSAKTLHLP